MNKKYWLIPFILFITVYTFTAYAHPGRTDSKGGHNDNSTGEYHYHHGFPAHQHTGGICPYDMVDKTGQNSNPNFQTASLDNNDDYNSGLEAGKLLIQSELETYKGNVIYIGIIVSVILVILISRIKTLKNKLQKNVEEFAKITLNQEQSEYSLAELKTQFSDSIKNINDLEEKIKSLNDYNILLYSKLFSADILQMAGVPPDIIIDSENLPHCYINDGIDIFIVYISKSGNKYHEKNGCSNSSVPIHIIKARNCGYIPCTKCITNNVLNNECLEWYTKYLSLINIKNKQTK